MRFVGGYPSFGVWRGSLYASNNFDDGDGVFLRANPRASSAFHRGNLSDVVCVYVDCVAFGDCFGQSRAVPSDGSFGAPIGIL